MGLTNSDKYRACHSGDIDCIAHFFFECTKVNQLRTKITVNITENMTLIGLHQKIYQPQNLKLLTNELLIVIAKMCVSKFRYGEICQTDLIFEKKELFLRKHLL